MSISKSHIPNWTAKERIYLVFAIMVAGFAAYETMRLGWIVYLAMQRNWENIAEIVFYLSGTVGVAVFFSALSLMSKGIDAIRERRLTNEERTGQ